FLIPHSTHDRLHFTITGAGNKWGDVRWDRGEKGPRAACAVLWHGRLVRVRIEFGSRSFPGRTDRHFLFEETKIQDCRTARGRKPIRAGAGNVVPGTLFKHLGGTTNLPRTLLRQDHRLLRVYRNKSSAGKAVFQHPG